MFWMLFWGAVDFLLLMKWRSDPSGDILFLILFILAALYIRWQKIKANPFNARPPVDY